MTAWPSRAPRWTHRERPGCRRALDPDADRPDRHRLARSRERCGGRRTRVMPSPRSGPDRETAEIVA